MERLTLSQFLKDNNAHASFIVNALAYEGTLNITHMSPIGQYFLWEYTKETSAFWGS